MSKVKGTVVQEVNQFGDFACPHCQTMFINPLNYELKAGVTNCQYCGKKFIVPQKIVIIANENARKYDKALDRVVKEFQNA
jgi:transcription elongation factor Elf1